MPVRTERSGWPMARVLYPWLECSGGGDCREGGQLAGAPPWWVWPRSVIESLSGAVFLWRLGWRERGRAGTPGLNSWA